MFLACHNKYQMNKVKSQLKNEFEMKELRAAKKNRRYGNN